MAKKKHPTKKLKSKSGALKKHPTQWIPEFGDGVREDILSTAKKIYKSERSLFKKLAKL